YPGGDDGHPQPTQGPSLDVYLAGRLTGQTPLPLLNFSMSWRTSLNVGVTSWNAGANPSAIPAINSPAQAFSTVFKGSPDAGAQGPDPKLKLRGSLLDALEADYERVNAKLSAGDRRLLDQHLTLVRNQEQRLQQSMQTPFSCVAGHGAPASNLSWQSTL